MLKYVFICKNMNFRGLYIIKEVKIAPTGFFYSRLPHSIRWNSPTGSLGMTTNRIIYREKCVSKQKNRQKYNQIRK